MKLIELLARELKEWPEGVNAIEQSDVDTSIFERAGGIIGRLSERADDTNGFVTRYEWEEATVHHHIQPVPIPVQPTAAIITPTLETMLTEWRDLTARAKAAQAEADALFEHAGQCHGEICVRLAELGWGAPRAAAVAPVTEWRDMTQPLNWQPGDVIKYVHTSHGRQFISGNHYTIEYVSDSGENVGVCHDSEGDSNGFNSRFFEWVSRPSAQQ